MKVFEKSVDLLIAYRNAILVVCLFLAGIAYLPSTQLKFERTVENLFRKDDPRYENYRLDKRLFGGIETAIYAYDDDSLFTEAGLARLVEIQNRLHEVEGVKKVTGVNDIRRPSAALESRSLLEQVRQNIISVEELKAEIIRTDLYRDRLVTADGNTALLLIELEPVQDDPQARADTILALKEIAALQNPPAVVLGGPVLVEEIFATLENDGVILGIASSLILSVVIAVLFRSVRWTLVPLVVVHVSLIWTQAIVALSGLKLSMVSAQLVAMITVIGVATSVHVIVRFREESTVYAPKESLKRTLMHVAPAIFWTCVTTAAGFAALLASSVAPFQTFALMMSLGSMLVFFAAIMLIPAAALMFPKLDTHLGKLPAEGSMNHVLSQTVDLLRRRPWHIAIALGVFLSFCSIGAMKLRVATDFTSNFRSDSTIVKSYHFLKERLPSLDTMDVLIEMPKGLSKEFDDTIESIRQLQEKIEADPRVVDTVSFVDLLDFLREASEETSSDEGSGLNRFLPALKAVPERTRLLMLQSIEPTLTAGFLNASEYTTRIIVQVKPIMGTRGKTELIEDIDRVAQQHFDSAKVAGFYVLLASVVQSLLADQWMTFALSIAAIFVLMTIAFRSFCLGLAAMIPNAAPIFTVLGAMGWLGLEINMATAMMASVSMGMSVDFSIHYLYRFQQELRKGRSFFAALSAAHGSVGVAMLAANFALIAGFLSLTLSALIPSIHFGLMVSVTMLGGLIGNLLILPLLLRLLWRFGWIRERGDLVPGDDVDGDQASGDSSNESPKPQAE